MTLKLYYDLMSQPSRALYILLKVCNYPFEHKRVDLRKGEHLSDDFSNKVNKLQKVPVIDHDGFILTESVAIIKYLARLNIIPDTLYPADTKKRARVDEFLEWQHIGLRLHLSLYFRVKYMDPILMGVKPDPKRVADYERRLETALENLDTVWLGKGNSYITGETVTVADLWAACEIEQPRMAGYDPATKYPNIATWIAKVRSHFSPVYSEAHIILNKVKDKYSSGLSASKL